MRQIILIPVMVLFSLTFAGPPVQDMSLNSIGIDYTGLWRGANITAKSIGAHESAHFLNARYAPLPYILISAGLGFAAYSVDTVQRTQFKGTFGLAPSGGINFFSPYFIGKTLRVTAGVQTYYLYSKNKEKSYLYQGAFVNPLAGVVLSIGENADIEIGGRGLAIFGSMEKSGQAALNFSNKEIVRGYLSVIVHTPSEGVYFAFNFDASPSLSMDWTKGPNESAIEVSLGCIIRKNHSKEKSADDSSNPMYEELRKKQDRLEQELK